MTHGESIRRARVLAGLSQKELAERLGITVANISQWESGRRSPKWETLERIAEALGMSAAEMLDENPGKDTKKKPHHSTRHSRQRSDNLAALHMLADLASSLLNSTNSSDVLRDYIMDCYDHLPNAKKAELYGYAMKLMLESMGESEKELAPGVKLQSVSVGFSDGDGMELSTEFDDDDDFDDDDEIDFNIFDDDD